MAGIYGSSVLESYNFNNDFSNFLSYIQESHNEINLIFKNLNVFKEDNNSLMVISKSTNKEESDKVQKTIIEKIKELWKRFIELVKRAFSDLAEKLEKMYIENNFQDNMMSKYKDIVIFSNLEKAKEKGWIGTPTTLPMINHLASPEDSKYYQLLNDKFFDYKIITEDDIESIIRSDSLEIAKEKYNEFKEKLSRFKFDSRYEQNSSSYIHRNNEEKDINGYYFILPSKINEVKGKKYYYPTPEGFAKTKKFAETGQSMIKQYKKSATMFIKGFDIEKSAQFTNMNSYKYNGDNKSENDEVNQINILYYKAKYENVSAIIGRLSTILNTVIDLQKNQHRIAILSYICYINAIKNYSL